MVMQPDHTIAFIVHIYRAVSVWDLREHSNLHRSIYEEKLDRFFVMRSSTYTTSATYDLDCKTTEIISILALPTTLSENFSATNIKQIIPLQICTLDEIGLITLWSVIHRQKMPNVILEDQGLVPWGSVVLVQGLTISMQSLNPTLKELHCYDLQCSKQDSTHLYVASNYGVLHCLTNGMKPKPKIYTTESDIGISITCIEMCPFSSAHFLAGCENGIIRLHSRFYEKSLMNLRSEGEDGMTDEKIELIQWSSSRPCVFYVKDNNNYVHIWDLLSSDIYPIYSVPFREEITVIKLSPLMKNSRPSMAIASKNGQVYLHAINDKFCVQSAAQVQTELNIFLNYIHRL